MAPLHLASGENCDRHHVIVQEEVPFFARLAQSCHPQANLRLRILDFLKRKRKRDVNLICEFSFWGSIVYIQKGPWSPDFCSKALLVIPGGYCTENYEFHKLGLNTEWILRLHRNFYMYYT